MPDPSTKPALEKLVTEAVAHLDQVCDAVERAEGDPRILANARQALGELKHWLSQTLEKL